MFNFSNSSSKQLAAFDYLLPKPEPTRLHTLEKDIIDLICGQLQYETFKTLDRQSRSNEHLDCRKGLLSLGLAAKIFLEPVLDVLWHTLSTVDPLLSVLPETTIVDGKKILVRQIAPASWDRLHFYTSRVRTFDQRVLSGTEESSVHYSVYARLGQTQPIFPALTEFHPSTLISNSNSLMFFLSNTMTIASLPTQPPPSSDETRADDNEATDFGPSLALLAWKVPTIQTLHLDAKNARYSGFAASISCFDDLQHLRVLRLSRYDSDFMSSIASLTKLSHLNLNFPPTCSVDFSAITDGFPSVKTLLTSGSPRELYRLLKLVPPSVLTELRLTFHLNTVLWENRAGMTELTRGLERFSSLSTLEIASVCEEDLKLSDSQSQFLWLLFSPLLRLRDLESLSYGLPLFLTDQKTSEMAEAWPRIQTLAFTFETWGEGIPSMQSLASFVQHCPKLTKLEYPIRVKCGDDNKTPCPPSPTLSMHPLRSFRCILDDDVQDPAIVALHLYQIFPGLEYVDGPGRRWPEVQSILNTFHFLSRQNRRICD